MYFQNLPNLPPVVLLSGGLSVWASLGFLLACWPQGSWAAFQRVSVPAPKVGSRIAIHHPGSEVT